MNNNEIKEYLTQNMVNAALQAGAAVMKIYTSEEHIDIHLKRDKTPIIDADRAAHTAIKEALGHTRIPILSEEGREMLYDERRSWEMFWLVDPLDGTVEFINKSNEFTINIALMSENRAMAAVVYVPCLNRLYFAGDGEGAFVRSNTSPDESATLSFEQIMEGSVRLPLNATPRQVQRVAVSRSHITEETNQYIDKLRVEFPDLEVVKQGSSYKFCMLAEGDIDHYVRTSTTYEWDTAAGELILAEAGGATLSLEGGEALRYNKEGLENPWFKCHSAASKIK